MKNISLCIPTMDRFDKFLSNALDGYLKLLSDGIIQEIVICDENGNDFDKINEKYSDLIDNGVKMRVYKNTKVLGVFMNKLKVCKMANYEYIALIDSDNIVDAKYFEVAREYMDRVELPKYFIVSPSYGKSHIGMDFRKFSNSIIDKLNVKDFIVMTIDPNAPGNIWHIDLVWNLDFISLLNMGNFILSKNIVHDVVFDKEIISKINYCDVMYLNSLVFKQLEGFNFHIVDNLECEYSIHDDSLQMQYSNECKGILWDYLVPYFRNEI